MPSISIIIPVLNEAERIESLLTSLPGDSEIIVVDGGSSDATVKLAEQHAQVIEVARGRAVQMNAGARLATGDVLLFLHADTTLPVGFSELLTQFTMSDLDWGRFDVRLDGKQWPYRMIETMMNLRSRWSGIATGDQAMFVKREVFEAVGGYPLIALMEDIELSCLLKKLSHPYCIDRHVISSARRWQQNGIANTILLMWWLRLQYFLGVSPGYLRNQYYK